MKFIFYFLVLVGLSGCAGGYTSSDPRHFGYKTLYVNDDIDYYIINDVLEKGGNNKYAKKEVRKKVKMAALKIVNRSDSALLLTSDNFQVMYGQAEADLMTPMQFYKKTSQSGALYLLWLFLSIPINTDVVKSNQRVTEFKTYYIPLGLPIGVGNIIVAANANNKFRNDIMKNSLLGKTILPGEEISGYIFFHELDEGMLNIQVVR